MAHFEWFSSSWQKSCDSSAGSQLSPVEVLCYVWTPRFGCLPPQLWKSVTINLEDTGKNLWCKCKWNGPHSLFVSIQSFGVMCCCCFSCIVLLGILFTCLNDQNEHTGFGWLKSFICFRMQRLSAANTLCIAEWISALSTLTLFCLQTPPFFSSLKYLSP